MKLLQTKLNKPQMYTPYIRRAGIHDKLAAYRDYKLVLVSGPAGSGKSTLLKGWLADEGLTYSWYNLDASDNDMQQFLSYLIACINQHPAFAVYDLSSLMTSSLTLESGPIIHSIIQVLQEVDSPLALILDDYHLISNPDIHRVMNQVLEHLPSQVQVFMTTREDPPLSLAKRRVNRQLLEVRAGDLQFTKEETGQFLLDIMKMTLSDDQVDLLTQKTEGWAAGIQLAGLSLQDRPNPDHYLDQMNTNHYIVDYFMEEVLSQMEEASLNFLLMTSLFNHFTADLCDYVLDLQPGQAHKHLTYLWQHNVFLIPLDDRRQWFRYHHLFRDLLSQGLAGRSMDVKILHTRASQWFRDHDHIDWAIDHACQGENWQLAGDLVENLWETCDKSLQANRWLNHFNKLPKDHVESRPVLLLGYTWALLDTGQHVQAKVWLQKAESLYKSIQDGHVTTYRVSDHDQYILFPSTLASAKCYIAIGHGQFDLMFDYAKEAFNRDLPLSPHRQGVLRMLMGLAYWATGQLAIAKKEIDHAIIDIKNTEGAITLGTYELVNLELLMDLGHYGQASQMLDQAIRAQETETKLPLALANFLLIYSRLHLAKGNLKEAIEAHKQSQIAGQKHALPDFWYKWYQHQASIQLHQGLYTSGLASIEEAKEHFYLNPLPSRTTLEGLKGFLYILDNKLDHARLCFDQAYADQDLVYKALLEARLKNYALAEDILVQQRTLCHQQGRLRATCEADMGLGLLAHYMGKKRTCLDHLKEAVIFVNNQTYVEPLMRYQSILGEYYEDLDLASPIRDKLALRPRDGSYHIFQANQKLEDPLTPRELDVLQLLAEGLSNQGICDQLFLALSTVKGYNQNIFAKLEVKRRSEAIIRARQLGLLDHA